MEGRYDVIPFVGNTQLSHLWKEAQAAEKEGWQSTSTASLLFHVPRQLRCETANFN